MSKQRAIAEGRPRAPASDAVKAATVLLERGGWALRTLEVDLVAGHLRVEAQHSDDGLSVTLWADRLGRVYLEREIRVWVERGASARNKRYPGAWDVRFLGREHYREAPDGLRALAAYLANNSGGRLPLAASREALELCCGAILPRLPAPLET